MASLPGDTMYAIQDVPGKDKGLIATWKITKGTRILCEEPILRFRHFELDPARVDDEKFSSLFARRVETLSPEKRSQFLALYNPIADVPLLKYIGVMKFNGIALDTTVPVRSQASQTNEPIGVVRIDDGLKSVEDIGIFHRVSRINHNCQSNTYTSWNDTTERCIIHALRDIEKGDEITMEYLNPYFPRHERQAILQETYGFDCTCRLCTLPPQQSREHDKLMVELQRHKRATVGYLNALYSLGMPPLCFLPSGVIHKAMMPGLAQCLEEVN